MSLFRQKYEASASIQSEREKVWKVLTDIDKYHLWNPFTTKVETDWSAHSRVILTVQMESGKSPIKQVEHLKSFHPPTHFSWGLNWWIFLKAKRLQLLRMVQEGQTEYYTCDVISGLLCPIVHWMYGKHIQEGFLKTAIALKDYIENNE